MVSSVSGFLVDVDVTARVGIVRVGVESEGTYCFKLWVYGGVLWPGGWIFDGHDD